MSVRGSIGSPLEEDLVAPPVSKASSPHSQVLHQAQILDLVTDQHLVKADWNQMGEWKTKTTEREREHSDQCEAEGGRERKKNAKSVGQSEPEKTG